MKLLSDRERKLLDMIPKARSVDQAARMIRESVDPAIQDLKMTTDAAYSMLYRIRQKYLDARTFVNVILIYRRKSALLKKVLTPAVKEDAS